MFTLSKVSGSATIIESRSDAVNICDAVKVWAMSNNQPVVLVCKSKTKSGWRIHAKMKNGWMMDVIAPTLGQEGNQK